MHKGIHDHANLPFYLPIRLDYMIFFLNLNILKDYLFFNTYIFIIFE
jgi:hypothetical protein